MRTVSPSTRAVVSWSGGKDSCLAYLHAQEQGLPAATLLTMMDPDGPSKSHALPSELLAAQARAMGMRWLPVEASARQYGAVFGDALRKLRFEGHSHVIFGDIDLQAHRDWLEPACRNAGLEPVFPLWGMARADLAREVIARGIRAKLVCVDAGRLDGSFCGAEYDADLLARLPVGVCPCGEDGEFHTFVWDAPCFAYPLELASGVRESVASAPPLLPTKLVFQIPELIGAGAQ